MVNVMGTFKLNQDCRYPAMNESTHYCSLIVVRARQHGTTKFQGKSFKTHKHQILQTTLSTLCTVITLGKRNLAVIL